jgi:hypothetical protein
MNAIEIPDARYYRNAEHRELWLSGLRLATGETGELIRAAQGKGGRSASGRLRKPHCGPAEVRFRRFLGQCSSRAE